MENVLVIAYNRPDCAKKLIESLLAIGPKKLFVALDGPKNESKDRKQCAIVRKIFESISWECEVNYLLGKENIGCDKAVVRAINWFFDYVDQGIILEDDCIPDPSFFRFCHELLVHYKDDERVFMVSGMSLIPFNDSDYDYRFSSLINIWGWATWKRAWQKLEDDLSQWPQYKEQKVMACYGKEEASQMELIDSCFYGNNELTWGIKWRLTCLANNAVSIAPIRNLVRNIGFDRTDAHSKTFYHPITDIAASKVQFPLRHPDSVKSDVDLDERGLRYYYNYES